MLRRVRILTFMEVSRNVRRDSAALLLLWLVALFAGYWLSRLTGVTSSSAAISSSRLARELLLILGFLAVLYHDDDGVTEDVDSGRLLDLLMTPVSRGQYLASKVAVSAVLATVTYLFGVLGLGAGMLGSQPPLVVAQVLTISAIATPFLWTISILLCAVSLHFRQRQRMLLIIVYVLLAQVAVPLVARSYGDASPLRYLGLVSPGSFVALSAGVAEGNWSVWTLIRGLAVPVVCLVGAFYAFQTMELRPASS